MRFEYLQFASEVIDLVVQVGNLIKKLKLTDLKWHVNKMLKRVCEKEKIYCSFKSILYVQCLNFDRNFWMKKNR